MYISYYDSPIGWLRLVSNAKAITEVSFASTKGKDGTHKDPVLIQCEEELTAYFDGALQDFNVPTTFEIGTPFQQEVWKALRSIPYGTCVSYKDIAIKIGNPKAVRAVGGANNKNPISIIVPCHRVIGANKKLVGYGGGLEIKEALLTLEGYM